MPGNGRLVSGGAARHGAPVGAEEVRRNLQRRVVLSLIIATTVVLAEWFALRPSVEAQRPGAGGAPLEAPAFVLPPGPPSDKLIGGAKTRIG
jgi:hypothetical protein